MGLQRTRSVRGQGSPGKISYPARAKSSGATLGGKRIANAEGASVRCAPGLECTIAEACPSHEASEWHFHLPIRDSINPAKLAEAFARHAHPEHRAYAPRLATLRAQDLRGYLQGFMDRLAFNGNAWGVIDWKTNKLGADAEAYVPQSMLVCAMDSHYLLQAHLYLVALRRYLRAAAPALPSWPAPGLSSCALSRPDPPRESSIFNLVKNCSTPSTGSSSKVNKYDRNRFSFAGYRVVQEPMGIARRGNSNPGKIS